MVKINENLYKNIYINLENLKKKTQKHEFGEKKNYLCVILCMQFFFIKTGLIFIYTGL